MESSVLRRTLLLATLCLLAVSPLRWARAEPPRTVAETSDYKATSRHADVVEFCERLAKESPLVRLGTLGTSQEGRKLPLVIIADPPVASLISLAQGTLPCLDHRCEPFRCSP